MMYLHTGSRIPVICQAAENFTLDIFFQYKKKFQVSYHILPKTNTRKTNAKCKFISYIVIIPLLGDHDYKVI